MTDTYRPRPGLGDWLLLFAFNAVVLFLLQRGCAAPRQQPAASASQPAIGPRCEHWALILDYEKQAPRYVIGPDHVLRLLPLAWQNWAGQIKEGSTQARPISVQSWPAAALQPEEHVVDMWLRGHFGAGDWSKYQGVFFFIDRHEVRRE